MSNVIVMTFSAIKTRVVARTVDKRRKHIKLYIMETFRTRNFLTKSSLNHRKLSEHIEFPSLCRLIGLFVRTFMICLNF